MKPFRFLGALVLAIVAAPVVGLAQPNAYPSKPVHIVVPYPAGGSGDFLARLIGTRLSQVMGQQFVVENHRAGQQSPSGNGTLEHPGRSQAEPYPLQGQRPGTSRSAER